MQVHNKKSLQSYRRRLRRDMTTAEILMWEKLRAGRLNGIKFKRQHSIGNYILDFYCAKFRLIIELDGMPHRQKENMQEDRLRDKHLQELNYMVLRFWNFEVEGDIERVLKRISLQINLPPSTSIPAINIIV